jgi:hypothetical protein
MLNVYGIRHHGPGSAAGLRAALEATPPAVVLVEGPPDADALLPFVLHAAMVPPVALLVYNPADLKQASFFPFAEFSPEWVAIRFALERGIPVRFMDLPMSHAFALRSADAEEGLRDDPFSEIAALAGFSDPERWWEHMFEHGGRGGQTAFDMVLELMQALRSGKTTPESRETLLREAWMRQQIRTALKESGGTVAVVCGAWHAPVLADTPHRKAADDAALLKGLKKVKTQCTWTPWTFERLARRSGYAAGVLAPAWYRVLWNHPTQAHTVWLSMAAQMLRRRDVDVASAHVIEAVRLSETLASLRGAEQPGLDALREAAVSVMGAGSETLMQLLEKELETGDVLGAVPDAVPSAPIKADFEAEVKKCRLEKSSSAKDLALDLREPAHLRKSRLLHRLRILGVPWGEPDASAGEGKQGRFHEGWELRWQPDYEVNLIEAGIWGNTVEDAARQYLRQKAAEAAGLPAMSTLLGQALKADLPEVFDDLLARLQAMSAASNDALYLADTLLPLAEVLRYGSARGIDTRAVAQVLDGIVPRLCIHLPAACQGIDESFAADVLKQVLAANRALGLLQNDAFDRQWNDTLLVLAENDGTAPLIAGLAARLTFDHQTASAAETATRMSYRLAHAQAPVQATLWLEGFLYGSGLLLIHHPALWNIVDAWLTGLSADRFTEQLPLLRRAFSRYGSGEREKLLELARNGGAPQMQDAAGYDVRRAHAVDGVLRLMVGS